MRRMSKFQAIQTLSRVHTLERNAAAAPGGMERRYFESQAKIERDALAAHGWQIVVSQGIECDVKSATKGRR